MMNASVENPSVTHLERLGVELGGRDYRTRLLVPAGEASQRPSLEVTNPLAAVLTDTIVVDGEASWWSWGDRIGPTADVPGAATKVCSVLRFNGRSST